MGTGLLFSTIKPESGIPYSTVHVGGDSSAFSDYGSFLGLAEQIDVGNQDLSDRALVFSEEIATGHTMSSEAFSERLAEIVIHEVGHLLGYVHSHDDADASCNPLSAVAAEYIVDSLDDTIVMDGQLTLREAIEAANTNTIVGDASAGSADEMDVIGFDPLLAGGTIQLNGTELSISGDLHIVGLGAESLTIDAMGLSRVFSLPGTGSDVAMEGLTITGGSAPDGGGLYVSLDTLTLTDCTVTGNSSSYRGGGLYIDSGTTTLNICTVSGNVAFNVGGGLYVAGGTAILTNCMVNQNSVSSEGSVNDGGGLVIAGGEVTITDSVIDENSAKNAGGLSIYGTDATVMLENSSVSRNSAYSGSGGGFYVGGGTVTLVGSTVRDNTAASSSSSSFYSSSGGGFRVTGGTLTLTNSTIAGNTTSASLAANSAQGGGVAIFSSGQVTLTGCTVSNNEAFASNSGRAFGGGIAIFGSGQLTLADCTVSENHVSDGSFFGGSGGGLFVGGYVTGVVLTNTTLSGNTASALSSVYGGGGGLSAGAHAELILVNCVIEGNSAGAWGGGLYAATIVLTNSVISKNSSAYGGGLYVGSLRMTNSTVSGNSASYRGGGLFCTSDTGTIVNSTISGNSASFSGGGLDIYSGTLTLNNTIVAVNTSSAGADIQGTYAGSANFIGGDPLFVRNASAGADGVWGTPDDDPGDLHLVSGSPCIDAGTNSMAVDADGNPLASDLRGYPRIVGGTVDIGAYEFGAFVVRCAEPRYIGDARQFQIELSEPVDPVSLMNGEVSLIDSDGGEVVVDVTVVDRLIHVELREALLSGSYTLVISPSVQSAAGNTLDQDLDGTGGEPEDECLIEVHVGV